MKKIIALSLLTISINSALSADQTNVILRPLPGEVEAQLHEQTSNSQQITLINNTDLFIEGRLYANDATKDGMLVKLNPRESKTLSLGEFYWFELKGTGYGSNSQPVKALMHSYAKKINLQTAGHELQTYNLGKQVTMEIMPTADNDFIVHNTINGSY